MGFQWVDSSGKNSFTKIYDESIRVGLTSIIGSSGAQAIYTNLNLQLCLDNPDDFHKSLFSLFKEYGTGLLEKAILKQLSSKIGENFDENAPFEYKVCLNRSKQFFNTKKIMGNN